MDVTAQSLEQLSVNLGKPQRRTLNGREFLVAPVTMIVPGVLNGSKGALYYPPEEVSKNPTVWNGTPIVLLHPQSLNGEHISARDPVVLNKQGLGWIFNSQANGKLTAEAWFDVEAVRNRDATLLGKLESGDKVELSTGLYTDNEPSTGVANGKEYKFIARNYRPDHLAILPGMQGACSVNDGCGVNVNQLVAEAKTIADSFDGTSEALTNHERYRLWDRLGELLGVNRDTGIELMGITSEDNDHKHEVRVDEDGNGQTDYSNGHSHEVRGFEVLRNEWPKGTEHTHGLDRKTLIDSGDRIANESNSEMEHPTTNTETPETPVETHPNKGGKKMKLNDKQRGELVDNLVANCDCWDEDDREVLNEFSDDKLTALAEKLCGNDGDGGSGDGVQNRGTKSMSFADMDDEELENLMTEVKNIMDKRKKKKGDVTGNSGGGSAGNDSERVYNALREYESREGQQKPLTDEEFIANAPPGVRAMLERMMDLEAKEKAQVIRKITANVADEDERKRYEKRLAGKELSELNDIAALIPEKPSRQQAPPVYFGSAFGPAANANYPEQDDDPDDILPMPVQNWAQIAEEDRNRDRHDPHGSWRSQTVTQD